MSEFGPCQGCREAVSCCTNTRQALLPSQIEFHKARFPEKVKVREDGLGGWLVFEGVCGYFESIGNNGEGKCRIKGHPARSIDCQRYPLDNDGKPVEREGCPRWHEFKPEPANCGVFDEEAGLVVV